MKKVIFLLFFVLFVLVSLRQSFAQTTATQSAETATKYNITFPIAALGNCTGVASCKTYCDDSSHQTACVSFAKQKGFYKQSEQSKRQEHLITEAKTELGCTSKDACMALCEQSENADKCAVFAKKFGIQNNNNREETPNPKILEKAKIALGCDSVASCKAFCQDTTNQDKCSAFAKTVGLHGGETRVGPGGCTSESGCKEFCTTHPDVCKQYSDDMQKKRDQMASTSATFKTGPGGCNSVESCTQYCLVHQDDCKNFLKTNANGKVSPEQMQQVQQIAGEYEKVCKDNPEKCKELLQRFMGANGNATGSAVFKSNQNEYCQKNPDDCKTGVGYIPGAQQTIPGKIRQYQQSQKSEEHTQGSPNGNYPTKQTYPVYPKTTPASDSTETIVNP